MRILQVSIENFRGIRRATIRFPSHALILGPNNACKSTVLEALNFALGPDRIRGTDPVDEHDFFQGDYLHRADGSDDPEEGETRLASDETQGGGADQGSGEGGDVDAVGAGATEPEADTDENAASGDGPEIRIEVVLGDLNTNQIRTFRRHIEPWEANEVRVLTPEEAENHEPEEKDFVLRVAFRAWYDRELDEFEAETVFLSPERAGGERSTFGRRHKQAVGFLYLRSLRTGRRAATLERGSLLDVLLREKHAKLQFWEFVLKALRAAGSEIEADSELGQALEAIGTRIDNLTPLSGSVDPPGSLQIGRLTRRHLRQLMTYFLASRDSDHPLPYDRLGSGTSNVLVFALLGAIGDVKDNVIFAMEEPEIALPPHTQRVVIKRLKGISQQAIVTSHSPYVAEQFLPDGLVAIRRSTDGTVSCDTPQVDQHVKQKTLRRAFRTRFAEGLLARTVVLVEGVTELWALPAAVDVLTSVPRTGCQGFDLDGVVFVLAEGTGGLLGLASYFDSIGIPVAIVCDQLTDADDRDRLDQIAQILLEHSYSGFERLLTTELDPSVIRRVAQTAQTWSDYPHHLNMPDPGAPDEVWRKFLLEVLKTRKGEGYAARVVSLCQHDELPPKLIQILASIRTATNATALEPGDPLAALLNPSPSAPVP